MVDEMAEALLLFNMLTDETRAAFIEVIDTGTVDSSNVRPNRIDTSSDQSTQKPRGSDSDP